MINAIYDNGGSNPWDRSRSVGDKATNERDKPSDVGEYEDVVVLLTPERRGEEDQNVKAGK